MSRVISLRPSENYFIDLQPLEVNFTWPSLVSMVLMRTFLVVVASKWGLESIIVSKKKKKVCLLSAYIISNTNIPANMHTVILPLRFRDEKFGIGVILK